MPKNTVLPPTTEAQKRDMSVNLRFSAEVYARLKALADYSNTTVAGLLFYVTVNTTLPMMEKEMQRAILSKSPKPKATTTASAPSKLPQLPPEPERS